jgi:hypothetical protein
VLVRGEKYRVERGIGQPPAKHTVVGCADAVVEHLAEPNGGGLRLRVKAAGASWLLRYSAPSGKRRELGLGAADRTSAAAAGKSLSDARDAADAARKLIRSGLDPIDEKRGKRENAREAEAETKAEARRERTTLARVSRAYHERVIEPRRTAVHAREWISSLERHVPKEIWHKPIAASPRRP